MYPFMYYESQFKRLFGVELRFITTEEAIYNPSVIPQGSHEILLQTWFDIKKPVLYDLMLNLNNSSNKPRIHFFDSFAHTDVRMSKVLMPNIQSYTKKAVFKDSNKYFKKYKGDTIITDYYSNMYDLDLSPSDFQSPHEITKILHIGPTFFTGAGIIDKFENRKSFSSNKRPIDIHARIATEGDLWYAKMRSTALDEVLKIPNVKIASGFGLSHKEFMNEMYQSKICFSPFGYGEICWRDIEAIQCGAVLLKPSMEHLKLSPEIHIPYETYMPVSWDFSDVQEKCDLLLSDKKLRMRISENAFAVVHDYVKNKRFVNQFDFIFS